MANILLIEDDDALAGVVARELAGEGLPVQRAADGRAGLRLFAQCAPDLVVLDWMLPGLNGLEVLRRIRQTSGAMVLMLTARDAEADLLVGLEVGADDYLTKPFSMPELIARSRALLRRAATIRQFIAADRGGATGTLRSGTLWLDVGAHRAELGATPLNLTPTEFALLALLLRNPGRVFSRAYLLETIWDAAAHDGDRAVDNAVARLRKKLADEGRRLETVWGIGYRWLAESAA